MVGRPRADPEQKQDFGDRTVTQGLDTQRPITEALQLRSAFDVGFSSGGLMGSPPDRPGNHMSGVDAALGQAHRDTPDLLDRPADQSTGGRALVRVFGGGMVFARWRTAAIIAKASITSATCRGQPCQDWVSL